MSMSSVFMLLLWGRLSSALVAESEADGVPVLIQRELLSGTDCLVNPAGEDATFVNPSNVDMAMVYIDGTDSDERFKPDFYNSTQGDTTDKVSDALGALKWCREVFGASSYPMFPSTADRLTAMLSLCDEKGSTHKCYMGMYRSVSDVWDSTLAESTCDTVQSWDGTFTFDPMDLTQAHPNGLGGSWSGSSQPTCQWYDSTHSLYEGADPDREYEQCLEYRPPTPPATEGKYHMGNCRLLRHIICYRPDTTCNVPVTIT